MTPRRRAYTLIEVLIAMVVSGMLLYALYALLVSGSRTFSKGVGAARGPEAALILVDTLERDLLQCLQIPGDPRPPVALGEGPELAFYASRRGDPLESLELVGEPVRWHLVPSSEAGLFHPARNQKVFRSLLIRGWELELMAPDEEAKLYGWALIIRVRFARESRVSQDFLAARLVHLAQPSSNFLHYPEAGGALIPSLVKMLPPPDGSPLFAALGPPRVGP